jgi:hypothetical protein
MPAPRLTPRRRLTRLAREDPEEAERRLKASRSERAQNSEAQGEERSRQLAPPPDQASGALRHPGRCAVRGSGATNLLSGYKTGGKLKRRC